MKKVSLLCVAAVLALSGCDQNSSKGGSGTNAASSSGNPADAPAGYVGALVKGQQTAVKTIDTASIQKAIQMFNVSEGRNPKDLNELVEKHYMPTLPEPPTGMKIVYDAQAGTVKVARQ